MNTGSENASYIIFHPFIVSVEADNDGVSIFCTHAQNIFLKKTTKKKERKKSGSLDGDGHDEGLADFLFPKGTLTA